MNESTTVSNLVSSETLEKLDAISECAVRETAWQIEALMEIALHLAKDHDFVCAAIKEVLKTTASMHHTPYAEQWPWGAKREAQ